MNYRTGELFNPNKMFDPVDDSTQIMLRDFNLMEDFLRLSLWSGSLGQQAQAVVLMDKPFEGLGAMPP